MILFSSVGNMLMIHPSIPAHSVAELVALAKKQPGQLTAGSAGVGTASHFAIELMNMLGGIKVTHVPYKGLAPAHVDVVGGQISMLFDNPHSAEANVNAASAKRNVFFVPNLSPSQPDAGIHIARLSR